MTCFEVAVNGRTVCKAGIGSDQQAVMTALLCAVISVETKAQMPHSHSYGSR